MLGGFPERFRAAPCGRWRSSACDTDARHDRVGVDGRLGRAGERRGRALADRGAHRRLGRGRHRLAAGGAARRRRAPRWTAPDGSPSSPISPWRGIRRCSRSATWSPCAADQRRALPGVAPVAIQQGRYVARSIAAGGRTRRFATATRARSRRSAAARGRADRAVRVSGFIAWILWLVVHLYYLVGFENRMVVLLRWAFSFFSRPRHAR